MFWPLKLCSHGPDGLSWLLHLSDICTYMTIPFSNSLFTRDKSVVYEHSVHLGQLMAGL